MPSLISAHLYKFESIGELFIINIHGTPNGIRYRSTVTLL